MDCDDAIAQRAHDAVEGALDADAAPMTDDPTTTDGAPRLPPGDRPPSTARQPRGARGEDDRGGAHRGRRGGATQRFYTRAPTRPGWHPTGEFDDHGKPAHSGQCEGCRVSTVVNFRPVVGGNPPLCGVCLDSLKAATAGADGGDGYGAGGASRGASRGGARHGGGGASGRGGGAGAMRFSPYGGAGQMIMVDPSMMMMMPHAHAGGGRGGGGRGKSRTWTRPGAEGDASGGGDTSNVPCLFYSKGSCRAGDSCKYSHAGVIDDDFVANTGENMNVDLNVEM